MLNRLLNHAPFWGFSLKPFLKRLAGKPFYKRLAGKPFYKRLPDKLFHKKLGIWVGEKEYGDRIKIFGNGRNGFSGP